MPNNQKRQESTLLRPAFSWKAFTLIDPASNSRPRSFSPLARAPPGLLNPAGGG